MLDFTSFHVKHFSQRSEDATVKALVIHESDNENYLERLNWMDDDASQYSVHYLVDKDGQVFECVTPDMKAWHCSPELNLHMLTDINDLSIGIELVHKSGELEYSEAQLASLLELCTSLVATYQIPLNYVVGYKELYKIDNRMNGFPWFEFLNSVACQVMERTLLMVPGDDD